MSLDAYPNSRPISCAAVLLSQWRRLTRLWTRLRGAHQQCSEAGLSSLKTCCRLDDRECSNTTIKITMATGFRIPHRAWAR